MKTPRALGAHNFDDRTMLGELPGVRYLFVCPACGHGTEISATKLMLLRGGGAKIADVVASMECSKCGRKGAPDVTIED